MKLGDMFGMKNEKVLYSLISDGNRTQNKNIELCMDTLYLSANASLMLNHIILLYVPICVDSTSKYLIVKMEHIILQ